MIDKERKYIFWVDKLKYIGTLIEETDTHFVIDDRVLGKTFIPKTTCVIAEYKGSTNDK